MIPNHWRGGTCGPNTLAPHFVSTHLGSEIVAPERFGNGLQLGQ